MWGILVALLSGALMSVQGVFNTELTKQSSLWVSTGWVQFSALLVCIAAWLFTGRQSIGALARVEHKYILLGRRNWSLYYYHCNSKYVCPGTCKGGNAYCSCTACSGISYRTYGIVWCGIRRIFSGEKTIRYGDCYCRNYYF